MGRYGMFTIDDSGVIVDHDDRFADVMRAPANALVGLNGLDYTAPADRERCIALIDQVLRLGETIGTVKRMIRLDGTHVWVHNTLSLAFGTEGQRCLSVIVDESAPPADWIEPAELLRVAKLVQAARCVRSSTFTSTVFTDFAWDILIAAYITEAEGRVLTTPDLHAQLGLKLVNSSRWIRALHAEGLLDYEDGGSTALITSSFRLSGNAHRKFERYLSDTYRTFAAPDAVKAFR